MGVINSTINYSLFILMNTKQPHRVAILCAVILTPFMALISGCTTKSLVVNEYKVDGHVKTIQEAKVKWNFSNKTRLTLTLASTVQQPKITEQDRIEFARRANTLLQSFSKNLGMSLENALISRGVSIKQDNEKTETEIVLHVKTIEDFCSWAGCNQKITIQVNAYDKNSKEAFWFSVYDTSIPLTDHLDVNHLTMLAKYIVSRMDVARLLQF